MNSEWLTLKEARDLSAMSSAWLYNQVKFGTVKVKASTNGNNLFRRIDIVKEAAMTKPRQRKKANGKNGIVKPATKNHIDEQHAPEEPTEAVISYVLEPSADRVIEVKNRLIAVCDLARHGYLVNGVLADIVTAIVSAL